MTKAQQAGMLKVSVHIMENREIKSSQTFLLLFPLVTVSTVFLYVTRNKYSFNCNLGERTVYRTWEMQLGGALGGARPKISTHRKKCVRVSGVCKAHLSRSGGLNAAF